MGERTAKNLVSLTRKAARRIRQTLDELSEELARGFWGQKLQPVYIPVRRDGPNKLRGFPGSRGGFGPRFFSSVSQSNPRAGGNGKWAQTYRGVPPGTALMRIAAHALRTNCRPIMGVCQLDVMAPRAAVRFFSGCSGHMAATAPSVSLWMRGMAVAAREKAEAAAEEQKRVRSPVMTEEIRTLMNLPNPGTSMDSKTGSVVEFSFAPTFTFPSLTFMDENVLSELESNMETHISELRATVAELKRVAQYGQLPMSIESSHTMLRVHFPNCDPEHVTALLRDANITKGIVRAAKPSISDELRPLVIDYSSSCGSSDLETSNSPGTQSVVSLTEDSDTYPAAERDGCISEELSSMDNISDMAFNVPVHSLPMTRDETLQYTGTAVGSNFSVDGYDVFDSPISSSPFLFVDEDPAFSGFVASTSRISDPFFSDRSSVIVAES